LKAIPAKGVPACEPGRFRYLWPSGASNLDQAAEQLTDTVASESPSRVDEAVDKLVRTQYLSLAHLATDPRHKAREFIDAVCQESAALCATHLRSHSAVSLYLADKPDDGPAIEDLKQVFRDAWAGFVEASQTPSIVVAAVPKGADSERFRTLAQTAWPRAEFVQVEPSDEIVLYVEDPRLNLAQLPHVGAVGRDAYEQIANSEHLSPHSRCDISEWTSIQIPLSDNAAVAAGVP
jgi:hypothetical protein